MQHARQDHHHHRLHLAATQDPLPEIVDQLAADAWLLCFDEFQVTDIADAMILRRLLSGLLAKGVVLVTTSNRHPDELYKNGIQRQSFIPCIQLLKQHCDVFCIDDGDAGTGGQARDYRRKLAQQAPAPDAIATHTSAESIDENSTTTRYIYPLGPETDKRLNRLFHELSSAVSTQQIPAEPRTLTVLGRPLRVPMQRGKVARFNFTELCTEAMSAADYLELCRHYETIFVADIPQMSAYMNRNELRRFITLVDTLYEHRVRLYCSAQVPIDQLLRRPAEKSVMATPAAGSSKRPTKPDEEVFDEVFAFSRTVSRLMQMLNASWPPVV